MSTWAGEGGVVVAGRGSSPHSSDGSIVQIKIIQSAGQTRTLMMEVAGVL